MQTQAERAKRSSMQQNNSDVTLSHKRSVRFDRLEIIQFQQTLGDNPSCSSGTPLTLDWKPVDHKTMLIDFYEFSRDSRRCGAQLAESETDRRLYLLGKGYSLQDILAAQEQADQIKQERKSSAEVKRKWGASILSAAKRVANPTRHLFARADSSKTAATLSARSA